MVKKLCPIHHYYYTSVECPICMQERLHRLSVQFSTDNKSNNESVKHKDENDKTTEITADMLDKLKNKFSSR